MMKSILLTVYFTIIGVVFSSYTPRHLIIAGKSSYNGEKPEECADDTATTGSTSNAHGNEIGVQCCNADGTAGYRQNLAGGEDYNGYNDCYKGVTYAEATNICESEGYRLCTADEIRSNVGAGEGCNHDARHVWSANPCGAHWTVIGSSEKENHSSGDKEEECTDDSSTTGVGSNSYGNQLAVQCCRDEEQDIGGAVGDVVDAIGDVIGDLFGSGGNLGTITVTEGYRQNLPGGTNYNGYVGCLKNVGFNAAEAACQANGHRLCTVREVADDIGKGTGCNHDWRHVWTANVCGENGLDSYLAKRYAPYLRFDSLAGDWPNGFPTDYDPNQNGKKSNQNMDSSIDKIPTYYHVYHDESGKPVSISYHWYYEFQTACLYDGVSILSSWPGALKSAITAALDGLDWVDPGDIGEHDNDNEKIFVNLNSDYSLKSVTYHQHNGKYTVTAASGKLQMKSTTHPHVYIGRTSHGSYHNALSSVGGCGYFHDYRSGGIKRSSWNNLQPAYWIDPSTQREDGWSNNGFCGSTGCNWAYCETSSEVNSNPDKCTPLKCNGWSTGCLPWGASDTVQAAASFKDKYFWLYDDEHPDCSCTTILGERVCAGENIKGDVCTPDFAEIYPLIPPNSLPIGDHNHYDHYNHHYQPNYKDDKNVTLTMSVWYLLTIILVITVLLINCIRTTFCGKCVKSNNNNNIKYKSVKMDSESEVEEDFIA